MVPPQADTTPLWGVDQLARITGGSWLRRPSSAWDPSRVQTMLMANFVPTWMPRSIMFITREETLERWFKDEEPPAEEPTGCVVVGRTLADSPSLPRERAVLVVDELAGALQALATAARQRHLGRAVAVTGSVGKTTSRRMLVHVLSAHGEVEMNYENWNLRAQVLERLASVRPDMPFLVYEAGLGGPLNALRAVSAALQPDVVQLTQLDAAHVDTITRREISYEDALKAVADQKLQLCEHMAPDGVVVVNRDIPMFEYVREKLAGRRVVTFGAGEEADFRLLDVEVGDVRNRVQAEAAGRSVTYELAVPGRFMAVNSVGSLASAVQLTGDAEGAAAALSTFEAVPGRARVVPLTIGGAAIRLIDDSFNATPLSVRSTLELLQESRPGEGGRRIAILGDIAHLGTQSETVHAELAKVAEERGVDRVYTFGDQMRHLQEALPARMAAGHFTDRRAMVDAIVADVRAGDVLTAKASYPVRFDLVVTMLVQAQDAPERPAAAEAPQAGKAEPGRRRRFGPVWRA